MILKYQLYPWTHAELARRVARELTLPVDAPKSLAEGTMNRGVAPEEIVNLKSDSQALALKRRIDAT